MSASVSVEASVKRYQDAMSSGTTKQKYQDGIDRTTDNPMVKAEAANDLYLQRVQDSVSSGRRSAALLSAPMARWKDNSKKKGADRLSTGAMGALDKVRAHFQKWAPIYANISDTVAAMPKGSREDSKARSAKAIDMLMDAAGKS